MVMVSSPTRTSLTRSRTIFWRSMTLSVSAALRKRARNAVRVSARRRNSAGPGDSGSETQPHDDWVGQLLLSRASQQCLQRGGKPRLQKATSVVVCQAQSDVGDQAVFEGLPTQRAGSSPPYQAAAPFPVCDIVNLSPRAGSGKSAHPVR